MLTALGAAGGIALAALADTSKFQAVDWQVVRPGYFDTMRTPLVAGRAFTEDDNNPQRNVVVVAEINPQYLVTDVRSMDALVLQAQASTRFSLVLIAVLATMAALLVAVGLYGVLSTVVRQRTAEIGVRMAVGAAPGQILRQVVGQGLRLSAAGVLLGLVAAVFLTRAMTTMLVGVTPTDPLTFAAMAVLFFVIAIVSSWLPARRAAGLDPTAALREG